MNDVTVFREGGLPSQFRPEQSMNRQAQADGMIEYARRLKRWPTLEAAVDVKIEEQTEFVRWWDENVGRPGGKGGGVIADHGITISADKAEELTGFDVKRVHRIRKRLQDPEKYRSQLYGAAWKKAFPDVVDENHRAVGSGENEWYTPSEIIELARGCMGSIDLDPASSARAQERVKAGAIFTAADDGLAHEWYGNVWLNPPYSQPLIMHFIEKLCAEYSAGRITAAICLTHNYTDTQWFHLGASVCAAVCFTRGRIGFLSPTGERASPTQGQAFLYFGDDTARFTESFSSIGVVFTR